VKKRKKHTSHLEYVPSDIITERIRVDYDNSGKDVIILLGDESVADVT